MARRPALLNEAPIRPKTWQELPSGEQLQPYIEQHLRDLSRQMFGYHLVKLGNLSSQLALPECQIKHHVGLTQSASPFSHMCSVRDELALQNSSIDAFLLAFELDFMQDPHQILREIDRTIIPNGYLVLVGFNPFSAAGLCKHLPIDKSNLLHQARFFSSYRVKDWLSLLGFSVTEEKHLLFAELFGGRKIALNSKFQTIAQRYVPFFSSLYIIVARKREYPLSLIKPKWRSKPKFTPVGASMRSTGPN